MGCPSTHRKPAGFNDDPTEILSHLARCPATMLAVSGVLQTDTWKDGQRIKLDQLFVRSAEGNLRIDTLSPVGQPLSTLVYDGGRLLVFDQSAGVFYVGSATREVIRKFLLVDIEPAALSILLGGCLPFTDGTPSRVSWDDTTGRYNVSLKRKNQDIQIWYEGEHLVRRLDLKESDRVYTLLLGDYQSVEGMLRPTRMKFVEKAAGLDIALSIRELRKLEQIGPETFMLEPPTGVEIRTL